MIDAIHFCVLGPLFAVFVAGAAFAAAAALAWVWEAMTDD